MTTRHPSAAFWLTVALAAVLVAYPLSFEPACWITSHTNHGAVLLPAACWPMTIAMSQSEAAAESLNWYARLCARGGWSWVNIESAWWWIER